ncbi:MAG: T9SS type A sorting domain-containing protein [Bacteroidetes bacterium]|nr:T9SS type A sorting domain-containing protein [Bacteroidota bacterium]
MRCCGNLIIEKGGKLQVEQGAIIELNGPNALIEVEDGGVVHIGDNATLRFAGTGRIKFIDYYPYYQNVTCGNNARINLTGSAQVSPQVDHVVLEVAGNESLCLPDNLAEFKVTNASINLGDNCRINAACPIYLDYARIQATNYLQLHRGLHTYGQANIYINQCTFKYGIWGIHADNKYYYNSLKVNQTSFKDCNTAIWVSDRGIVAEGLRFENCKYGIDAQRMSVASSLTACYNTSAQYYQTHSVLFKGLTGGSLKAVANDFSKNSLTALWYKGPSLTLRCNNINDNSYGVYASPITLNMSETYSKLAGRNKIQNNSFQNIYLTKCSNILLENGYNNLSSSNASSTYKSVQGKSNNYHWLMVDMNGNVLQTMNIPLYADNNYWDDNAAYNNPTTRTNITHTNPVVKTPVNVVGSSLSNGNVQNLSECQPRVTFENPAIALPPGDNGVTLWGDYFSNVEIQDAVSTALVKQFSDNDLITAIDMYHDIITHVDYRYASIGVRRLLDICYGKMQEAISEAAADSTVLPINRSGYLHPAFTKLIEVNNHLLQDAPESTNDLIDPGQPVLVATGSIAVVDADPDLIVQPEFIPVPTPASDYGRKLELNYNTAFAYRMAQHHQTCLDLLNNMQSWMTGEDLPLLNYYQCIISHEIEVINNTVNKFELESTSTCIYPDYLLAEENMAPVQTNKSPNQSKEKEQVLVLPNPTQGATSVEIQLNSDKKVTIYLYDVTGRLVKELLKPTDLFEGANHINIDLTSLPSGVYTMRTYINGTLVQQKLVKQ